ncbi:MAG TPA: T3SS effector HopA1 family protein [Solirubrobacteraceae bacterium]|nr:T3SS effector HopA1 family protein [Solirubrobacteraceae bacterium]
MLRRVAVDGPDRARVDGVEVASPPGSAGEAPVLDALAGALYHALYAGLPWPADPSPSLGRDLRPELAAANAGRDGWEAGWTFVRTDLEGRAVAQRGMALRAWWPGHWVRADGVPGPLVPGTPLRIFHPAAPGAPVQEGFWFAFGRGGPDGERRRVRTYFNVSAAGAAELVRALTGRLHALEVPFTLKVADREALAARRDSAVLWSEARHFRVVAAIAREVAAGLREPLGDDVPPFSKPLAPGVGVAEDPRTGFSFGMERCGVVAEGLWLAAKEGAASEEDRLAAVARAFAARDFDPERPWLAARGNPDRYDA